MSEDREKIIGDLKEIFHQNAEVINYMAAAYRNTRSYEKLLGHVDLDSDEIKECHYNDFTSRAMIYLLLDVFSYLDDEALVKFDKYLEDEFKKIGSYNYERGYSCDGECDFCFDDKHRITEDEDSD